MSKADGIEVARISVKVSPSTRGFGRELKRDLESIERSVKAQIDVEPDTRGFRRKLKSDLEAIERAISARIGVTPNMRGFRSQVEAGTQGMRTSVKVDADIDRRGFFGRIANSLSKMQAPSFGSGINPSGYLLIGSLFAALSPLIAGTMGVLTTGLMALPGLITAAAVPIGALALGMDGLTKAAERLKQPFDDLKALMSARVEEQFIPFFEQMRGIFPSLERTLPNVTQGMADMANAVAGVLTDPANLAKIEGTIDNIAQGLKEAAPGIGSFTQGFLDLVNGFSTKLPDIGKWFSETGKSFSDWVTDFTTKGPDGMSKFDHAMQGLGDTLKIVGGGLVELGGKALDFFSDPEKIQSFKAQLDGLLKTILAIADGINSMASALSKVPGLSDGEANGPMDFAPVQIQVIKEIASNWSEVWAGIKIAAKVALTEVATAVGTFVSDAVSSFRAIGPAISGMWSEAVAAAQSAWSGIVNAVTGAAGNVVSSATGMVGDVVSALANLAQEGLNAGRDLVQGLINGIGGMISSAVSKARELASSVAGAVKGFLGINSPSKLFAQYGQWTAEGFGKGLENGFEPVLDQAKDMAQKISDAFTSGSDATALLGGFSKREIDRMEKVLRFESKRLEAEVRALNYQASATGNEALKARVKELRMQNDQIGLQKDMIGLAQDYSEELGSATGGDDPLVKAASGLMNAPVDFAKATGQQFLSDLGIAGDGMLSRAITEGISYIFQIGSVDEALSIKDREESKQKLAVTGR